MNTGAKKISGVRALIFDLDGTLIDSKLDLALSVNAALAEMGRPSLPHEQIFGYVGEGAPMLLQRAMGEGASGDECRRALEFFLAYYRAHMLDNTVTYPGVREGLEQLAGLSMAAPRRRTTSSEPAGPRAGMLIHGLTHSNGKSMPPSLCRNACN